MNQSDSLHRLNLRTIMKMSTVLFSCVGLILALVYWIAVGKVRNEIDDVLDEEIAQLRASYKQGGHDELVSELLKHVANADVDQGYYLLEEVATLLDDAQGNVTPHLKESLEKLSQIQDAGNRADEVLGLKGVDKFVQKIATGNLVEWPSALVADDEEHTVSISLAEEGDRSRNHYMRAHAISLPNGERVLVARDVTELVYARNRMRKALAGAGGMAFILVIATAFLLNRSLLSRVRRLNGTVLKVMAGKQGERMPPSLEHDDFEELADHFNKMLDEKDRLLAQIREITDDIAHDLRTPLTRMRQHIESTMALPMDNAERDEILQKVLGEADLILETFNALLFIAQVESGAIRENMEEVSLSEIVTGSVELYEPFAEEAGSSFLLSLDPQARILGNRHLLAQAFSNLIDNAIKYSPEAGKIEVGTRVSDEEVILRIRDFGIGIPEAERESVLQRFVRLDSARHLPGTGLGLSFVSAVTQMHGANLTLEDGHPGLVVTIHFQRHN